MGTLMRKIARQPKPARSAWTNHPPRIWPAIEPIPVATPYQAMAHPRRSPGNTILIAARTCGIMTAAAKPCRIRAKTRKPAEPASPHSRDVAAKSASPHRYILRCPYMSPRRPPVMSPLA